MILLPTTFWAAVRFERMESSFENELPDRRQDELTMKFCAQCNNMLYSIEERERVAFLKCRSCPYEEPITKENPVVYDHDLRQDTSVQYTLNKYLKYDPTLPRFTNLVCPNKECTTRGGESDIVGIKLDSATVLWFYQCAVCDTTWKQLARAS
jgi:DNA-directed RNA polymerase subunit M/transcription elongation factor TFIIS